jgi:hypothetical protein
MPTRGRSPYTVTDGTSFGEPNPRLKPPDTLGDVQKRAFVDLVTRCPATQFEPCDLPLLCRWSELTVMCERAATELAMGGLVTPDGKVSAWFGVHERACKGLVALALRLRVAPQARSFKAPKRQATATSYYDKLALLEPDDGDEAEAEADQSLRS